MLSKELLQELKKDPDRLIEIIVNQSEMITTLRKEICEFKELVQTKTDEIARLQTKLEEAQRNGHRQAGPFRINEKKRTKEAKKPGRKQGHDGFYRKAPEADRVDCRIEVNLEQCPQCGAADFHSVEKGRQFIEDLPVIRAQVTELTTYQGVCCQCQSSVRSGHPLQVSEATGAARCHLGARALGLAAQLNKGYGLSHRKCAQILRDCFDLKITPGGLTQALHRVADRLEEAYKSLKSQLQSSDVLHSDETSWWVGGPKWWLWVFTNQEGTVYEVHNGRGRAIIEEFLEDFEGVLVTDCLNIYDEVTPLQQKCYAHHLKAVSAAIEEKGFPEQGYLIEVRSMLKSALLLKGLELPEGRFKECKAALEQTANRLLQPSRGDPVEEKVRNRLFKQRTHLVTFLDFERVEATNNLAERQLRPAVIARKLSCGNKTEKGAHSWQIITSLAATCRQTGKDFAEFVAERMTLQPAYPALAGGRLSC